MSPNNQKLGGLKRSSRFSKVSGICAGIALHYGYEVWVVRLIAFCILMASPPLFIMAYIVGTLILDKDDEQSRFSKAQNSTYYRPSTSEVWRRGGEPKRALKDLDEIYTNIERRLENIEKYVTSSKYELNKQFRSIR